MKFKYMIRGLGLGVIITAAVLGAYNRNAVADARVAVLKDYGLDGESPLAEETSTAEEASAAESTEPVIMRDDEKEAEIESVLDAAKDAENSDNGASDGQAPNGEVSDGDPSNGEVSDGDPSNGEVSDGEVAALPRWKYFRFAGFERSAFWTGNARAGLLGDRGGSFR